MSKAIAVRSKNLNIRIRPEERDLFTRAAASQNQNLSEFVLEAANHKAEEVLLDANLFELDEERYQAFVSALEAPVKSNPELKQLLRRKPLWEK